MSRAVGDGYSVAVEAIYQRTWEWLYNNRAEFDFDDAAQDDTARRLVAFGELLTILTIAVKNKSKHSKIPMLVEFASHLISKYDWQALLLRKPRSVVAILTIARFLLETRGSAGHFRILAARSLELSRPGTYSPQPLAVAEAAHLFAECGFKEFESSLSGALKALLRTADVSPALFTPEIGYAVAHVVFYATREGSRDCNRHLSPANAQRVRWLLEVFTNIAIMDGNLDLVAELLLCQHFCKTTPVWQRNWAVTKAHAAQRRDGAMPTLMAAAPESAFLGLYHSTLTWALLVSHLRA